MVTQVQPSGDDTSQQNLLFHCQSANASWGKWSCHTHKTSSSLKSLPHMGSTLSRTCRSEQNMQRACREQLLDATLFDWFAQPISADRRGR